MSMETVAPPAYIKIHALTNLQFLCRLCAGNIKNRIDESLSLVRNPALKETCEKFLHIQLDADDLLPKLICKACYRTVAGAEALANVAKQTQKVFGEYFEEETNEGQKDNSYNATNLSQKTPAIQDLEYTPLELNLSKKTCKRNGVQSLSVSSKSDGSSITYSQCPITLQTQIKNTIPRKAEVVVNVSVNDPLTRDNQQKVISHSQRRQSLLIDSRYTPKSIAQKSMTAVGNYHRQQQQQQQKETIGLIANIKKQSPPGVINFFPNITAAKYEQNKLGTESEYIMRRLTLSSDQNDLIRSNIPSPNNPSNNFNAPQQMPVDFAQPKRRNQSKVLTNIKSCTGQISLLKSSHKKNQDKSSHEMTNCVIDEPLPEKMIIAAPKEKTERSKKSTQNSSNKNTGQNVNASAVPTPIGGQNQISPIFPDEIPLGRVIKDIDLLKLILKALKWPVTNVTFELQMNRLRNSKFTDIMSDSNLLQDMDIVQLLQPYLAPVLLAAQAIQQQQFLKAVQSQSQSQTQTQTQAQAQNYVSQSQSPINKPIDLTTLDINNSLPYKLPPETSVQLVPAQPNLEQKSNKLHQQPQRTDNATKASSNSVKGEYKSMIIDAKQLMENFAPSKKVRRTTVQKARDSIIISDEDNNNNDGFEQPRKPPPCIKNRASSKSSPNFHLDTNSALNEFALLNSNVDTSSEALLALLQRQKAALNRQQRAQRRRHSNSNLLTLPPNEFDALLDLGNDIVLMEQENNNVAESMTSSNTNTNTSVDIVESLVSENNKKLSSEVVPIITRPIIKRRKTVIQTVPRNKTETESIITATAIKSPLPPKPKLSDEIEASAQISSNVINTGTQICKTITESIECTSKATSTEVLPKNSVATSVCSLALNTDSPNVAVTHKSRKQLNSAKSALGQQLLEAIGLQKVNNNQKSVVTASTTTPKTEGVTTSTTTATESTAKESVQQIRSALKRSLKQAQEQQQQRKQELSSTITTTTTVIQDADSTTPRSVVKEVIVEGKHNSGGISSMVDLEEQIDKVTLVRKSVEQHNKDGSKDTNVKQEAKIVAEKVKQSRGRLNLASHHMNTKSEEKSLTKIDESSDEKLVENKGKQSLECDSYNITSSSGTTGPLTASDTVTSSDVITIKQEVITPKRRGRKRNVDKESETAIVHFQDAEGTDKMKSKETDIPKVTCDDNNSAIMNTGRPTRHSKTLSKYYKGPEKFTTARRSLPTRATRNR